MRRYLHQTIPEVEVRKSTNIKMIDTLWPRYFVVVYRYINVSYKTIIQLYSSRQYNSDMGEALAWRQADRTRLLLIFFV